MRKIFDNRGQLLELLKIFPWAEGKCGPEAEGKWGTIVIFWIPCEKKYFKNPIELTIWLDRNPNFKIMGYLYIHGPLNSYLGFNNDPWCEHFDVHHRPWSTRLPESIKQCEEEEFDEDRGW